MKIDYIYIVRKEYYDPFSYRFIGNKIFFVSTDYSEAIKYFEYESKMTKETSVSDYWVDCYLEKYNNGIRTSKEKPIIVQSINNYEREEE